MCAWVCACACSVETDTVPKMACSSTARFGHVTRLLKGALELLSVYVVCSELLRMIEKKIKRKDACFFGPGKVFCERRIFLTRRHLEVCRDLSSMTKRRLLKGAEGGKTLSVCQVFSRLTHYLGKCAIHIFKARCAETPNPRSHMRPLFTRV